MNICEAQAKAARALRMVPSTTCALLSGPGGTSWQMARCQRGIRGSPQLAWGVAPVRNRMATSCSTWTSALA
eukprot:12936424-Prorocentrum_lima.AAC.1